MTPVKNLKLAYLTGVVGNISADWGSRRTMRLLDFIIFGTDDYSVV